MGVLFISHSSKNNDEAIELRDWLRAEGYSETFLDLDPEHGLAPGQRWEEELQKAGERCSGIVILISPEWAESKWCFHEFKFAKALGKKIFPVLIKPTPFAELPRELHSHYQLADISSPELKQDGLTRLRIGLRRAGLDPKSFAWPPEDEPDRSPYRGLQALTEKDAAVFFGRDAQITAGLDKLRQMRSGAPKRILTIAAASGAGKSSFLKAGLLARLERDTQNFLVLPTVRPARDALEGETGVLKAFGMASVPATDSDLLEALGRLQAPIMEHLTLLAEAANESYDVPPPTLVLPIDQAEELFSIDDTTGEAAVELLKRSLAIKLDLVLILTIRSDSLGRLQADSEIATQLELFNLPALPPAAFKEVIEGPAALAQPPIEIDPALTTRLINDLNRSDALPLLAFTMERLAVEYAEDHLLELHAYTDGLGGVSGAINAAVEAAFVRAESDPALPDSRYDLDMLARKAFIPQLVQIDEADSSPKRRVTKLSDLPLETRPLLKHFVEERLLVQSRSHGQAVVEVSHEAVLRHWRGLSAWVGEERTMLIGLQRIKRSAEEWGGNEKTLSAHSPDLLVHRGERLTAAEAFFERDDFAKDLEGQPTAYLKACRRFERKQEARGKLWRRLTTAMVFIAAALTGWGLFSTVQGQRAVQQNFATFLNNEAIIAFDEGHFDRSMRLAVLSSADSALNPTDKGANFTLGRASTENRALIALEGHSDMVRSAAFSPDGSRIVTASWDDTARVWTQTSDGGWQSAPLEGHSSRVYSATHLARRWQN
ncbi:MAG: TIR domain-containing protein, partial [Pseudomonadota bacterium]